MTLRELTKKEKELITLITDYSKCYSKEKTKLFTVIKFDEIKKETRKELLEDMRKKDYIAEGDYEFIKSALDF